MSIRSLIRPITRRPMLAIAMLLGALGLALLPACASPPVQRGSPDWTPDIPPLGVGDPAPAFEVDHWIREPHAMPFDGESIYVVEFWATWCGSCIAGFPELAELQAEHADEGVVVIAATNADDWGCTLESATAMAMDPERRMEFGVAFLDDKRLYDAWAGAAGHRGIPTALVVDRSGRLVYVGYERPAHEVVEELLAGTFDMQAAIERHEKVMITSATIERYEALLEAGDPGASAFAWAALEGPTGEVSSGPMAIAELALDFTPDGMEPNLELALAAARRGYALRTDETDLWYDGTLAEAEFRAGNVGRAIEVIELALRQEDADGAWALREKLAAYRRAAAREG
ncbi:MAG: TlpA disulfide reductase family protein [Phycisphaerales bacterium]|jgi:thiol-disulfide isomerase/thioredoxin